MSSFVDKCYYACLGIGAAFCLVLSRTPPIRGGLDPGYPCATVNDPRPSCSIILATLSPWVEIRPLIEELLRQAHLAGGELVVADGIGQSPYDGQPIPGRLRWIPAPGLGVFALRLMAIQAARASQAGKVYCFFSKGEVMEGNEAQYRDGEYSALLNSPGS